MCSLYQMATGHLSTEEQDFRILSQCEHVYRIICSDGECTYTHRPGPYSWRYISKVIAYDPLETTLDLSTYFTCETVQSLQDIFSSACLLGTFNIEGPGLLFNGGDQYSTTRDAAALTTSSEQVDGIDMWKLTHSPTREKCLILTYNAFYQLVVNAELLDIRYDLPFATYVEPCCDCHERTLRNVRCKNKEHAALRYIPEGLFGSAPHHVVGSYSHMTRGIYTPGSLVPLSEYIPIAMFQRLMDAQSAAGYVPRYLLPEVWADIASVDFMEAVLKYISRCVSFTIAKMVIPLLDYYMPSELQLKRLHPAIVSYIMSGPERRMDAIRHHLVPNNTFAKKIMDVYSDIKKSKSMRYVDRLMAVFTAFTCDGTHEQALACPMGLNCKHILESHRLVSQVEYLASFGNSVAYLASLK